MSADGGVGNDGSASFDAGLDAGADGGGPALDAGDGLPTYEYTGDPGPTSTFEHGVASGDPSNDAVLLWTRVSTGANGSVDVFLEVALDEKFTQRVAAGWFSTDAHRDYTLTVDQTGLLAGATYYYRFHAFGRTSDTGRTRTLPGSTEHVRLGVVSCSSYAWGYFHAYRHLCNRDDIDAIVHLGDYIYEHANSGFGNDYGNNRLLLPWTEIVSLEDYRTRYSWYRQDPDLKELHRLFPMIHVWDDHEFANDPEAGGASNHQPSSEGDWNARVAAALQAYSEWLPTRLVDESRIYRSARFGELLQLTLVDRQRRFLFPAEGDEGYLGTEQGNWLDAEISAASAQWFLLGCGKRFAPRDADGVSGSHWDTQSFRRVIDPFAANASKNLVVVSGDTHRFDALDIVSDAKTYPLDAAAGSAGVEFAVGSVCSPGTTGAFEGVPQYKFSDGENRGYLLLDITPKRLRGELWGFADSAKVDPALPSENLLAAYEVEPGNKRLIGK